MGNTRTPASMARENTIRVAPWGKLVPVLYRRGVWVVTPRIGALYDGRDPDGIAEVTHAPTGLRLTREAEVASATVAASIVDDLVAAGLGGLGEGLPFCPAELPPAVKQKRAEARAIVERATSR